MRNRGVAFWRGPVHEVQQERHPWGAGLLAAVVLGCAAAAGQDFSGGQKVPGAQDAAMAAANASLAAGDWGKAEKLLEPLAAANPRDARVLYDLGSAQDALEQATAAEQSYRSAIEDDGGYLEPRLALGLLLARSGRMADARAELGAAAGIEKGDKLLRARALRAMARIDERTRPGDARDELLAAIALSPETPEDRLMSAELTENATGGQAAAEAAYRGLLVQQPNDPQATAGLGHLLAKEKRYDEAEQLLLGGLAAHAGDTPLTIQLASVYVAAGKLDQALPLVERLHAANAEEPAVARLLAELYVQAQNYEKAEPLLASLSAQSPHDGDLADLHAEALLHLHRGVEAQRILARVVPDRTAFSGTEAWGVASAHLAFCASQNNQPLVALQTLQERAKVLPPSPPILFLTAISADKLHQVKNAVEAYKSFLAASNGANPNEEFEATHRLVALEHSK